jgi:hypothetical protein
MLTVEFEELPYGDSSKTRKTVIINGIHDAESAFYETEYEDDFRSKTLLMRKHQAIKSLQNILSKKQAIFLLNFSSQ